MKSFRIRIIASGLTTGVSILLILPGCKPKAEVAPKPVQVVQVEKPTSTAPKVTPAPKRPDLDTIPVKGRSDLTNATIREILSDGVLFMCDQGLVKAKFTELPVEFETFYAADAAKIVVRPVPPKPKIRPVASSKPHREDLGNREEITKKISDAKWVIEHYNRPSSQQTEWDKKITQQEYDQARYDLNRYTILLTQLPPP